MMKIKSIEKIIIKLVLAFTVPLLLYLSAMSFVFTWVNTDLMDEYVYRYRDSILLNLLAVLIVIFINYMLLKKEAVIEKVNTKYFALALSFLAVLISIYWVLNSSITPYTDQLAVCEAASGINAGDFTTFEQGNYIARYHQQLGIVSVIRVIFYLFGDYNFTAFQLVSACSVFLIIFNVYRISSHLSDGNKLVEIISTVLVFICLPIYFYTPFVYGELIGIAFMLEALSQYLELQNNFNIKSFIAVSLSIFMALMVRLYAIIMVIAMLGVVACQLIYSKEKTKKALIIVSLMLGIFIRFEVTDILYDKYIDRNIEALPLISNIAMGTNNAAWQAGWYDGSSVRVFEENGYSADAAREASMKTLDDFFETCKADPKYGIGFFARKTGSQWAAPMYQSIVMNNNVTGKQSAIVALVYNQDVSWRFLDSYMNYFQIGVYLFALLLLCFNRLHLEKYVGIITVLGGFMWSVLGEAKTRYVFPYFIILIPYAVFGMQTVVEKIKSKRILERK